MNIHIPHFFSSFFSARGLAIVGVVFFVLGATTKVVFAGWVNPPDDANPPEGGVAPLNVAAVTQEKGGGLYVGASDANASPLYVGYDLQTNLPDFSTRVKINGASYGVGTTILGFNDKGLRVSGPTGGAIAPAGPADKYGGFFEVGGVGNVNLSGIYSYVQPAVNKNAYGVYGQVGSTTSATTKSYGVYGLAGTVSNSGVTYGVYADTGAGGNPGAGEVYGLFVNNRSLTGSGRGAVIQDTIPSTQPTVEVTSQSTDSGIKVSGSNGGYGIDVTNQSSKSGIKVTQSGTGSALRLTQNTDSYDYLASYIDGRVRIAAGTNDDHTGLDILGVYGRKTGTLGGSALYVEQGASQNFGIYASGSAPGFFDGPLWARTDGPGETYAVLGAATGQTNAGGNRYGVQGTASDVNSGGEFSAGVYGKAGTISGSGSQSHGVYGEAGSPTSGGLSYGVYALSGNAAGIGLYAENTVGGASLLAQGYSFFASSGSNTLSVTGTENVLRILPTTGDGVRIESTNTDSNSVYATGDLYTEKSLNATDLYLKDNGDPVRGSYRTYIKADGSSDPKICIEGVGDCALELASCTSKYTEEFFGPGMGKLPLCQSACADLTPSDYRCSFSGAECDGRIYNQCSGGTTPFGSPACTQLDSVEVQGSNECYCNFSGPQGNFQRETFVSDTTLCAVLSESP